jgi:flavorubredoxin
MKTHGPIDYDRPVEIAPGIFWVGFYDVQSGLHCNPYLVIDGSEAVVIDGGSRPDFPTVMMKILQTGIFPHQIRALIYHHYDPDLCGSLPNFEDIIGGGDLGIISAAANNMFIRHYAARSRLLAVENIGSRFVFSSGRTLEFIKTPYAHAQGSMVTYDAASGILFSSDLLGSYGTQWELFFRLDASCLACVDEEACRPKKAKCPVRDVMKFHEKLMPSTRALRHALTRLMAIPFKTVAPQHGSIIAETGILRLLFARLAALERVGIDGVDGGHQTLGPEDIAERFRDHAG